MMTIASIFTISILLMILLPLIAAIVLRRTVKVPWIMFSAGMVTFTISQVVHLPLNHWLGRMGWLQQVSTPEGQPIWLTALILGLTAGLCEELSRAAGYAILKKSRFLQDGLMMGIGHGGIEAIVFGGILTAGSVAALLPMMNQGGDSLQMANLLPEQILVIEQQIERLFSTPWVGFLPLVERFLVMGIHVTWSVMVLKAFQQRNPLWLIAAVLYHAILDAAAVLAANYLANPLLIEFIILIMVLPGYLWLGRVIKNELPHQKTNPNPLARELHLFLIFFMKEWRQLWRTKRVLITAAVFGLFGLASPLLAYFLPEMMQIIPGAEAFADLIPIPTAGDAMLQYHKNLTQFAFLLAVILGMGCVAGEKERGSAGLILSKPLPRWAYLTSKFAAQSSLFLWGFTIGAVGGYTYTVILFGPIDAGKFIAMNLVLMVWILPFVALTLVGSVLSTSTTMAGGISLGLVLVLFLVGGIPQISTIMPTSLSQWAAQLGILAAGTPASTPGSAPVNVDAVFSNFGALASALGIVILCLILSYSIFERQEF
jgi:ABC-2 type transport system permease protein